MPNRNHFIAPRERQGLVSLTAIYFIEDHRLLSPAQLAEAKQSLQALFLRASGEETMLRKLIEVLRMTRALHVSFAGIAGVLQGAAKCVATVEERLAALRERLKQTPVSAEAHADFVGRFLSFSQTMTARMAEFARLLQDYLALKEGEARAKRLYEIAVEAREQLRRRLSGELAAEPQGEAELRIKSELLASFDFGEAQAGVKTAAREALAREKDLDASLARLKTHCRMAMNPDMRDPLPVDGPATEDVFARFTDALPRHPELATMKDEVLQLFKLYQHAYGLYSLDYEKLKRALATMLDNTEAYFQSKEQDRDLAAKREKLRRIEGLIPFLEQSSRLALANELEAYHRFSRELSALVTQPRSAWAGIAEDLLRAKVQAEAEISTRL